MWVAGGGWWEEAGSEMFSKFPDLGVHCSVYLLSPESRCI